MKAGIEKDWDLKCENQKPVLIQRFYKKKLRSTKPYVDGKLHGILRVYYHESGEIECEIPYERSKKHGLAKRYDKAGTIVAEQRYTNDRKYGNLKIFSSNPELKGKNSKDQFFDLCNPLDD